MSIFYIAQLGFELVGMNTTKKFKQAEIWRDSQAQ